MEHEIDRIECAIRHIESSLDVDPWACEIAVHAMQELIKRTSWIPVTERLPEKPFGCLVTVCDTDPVTFEDFENILPYFVGYDGKQWNDWEGEQCPFEVLAWLPLPEPYKEGRE